MSTGPVGIGVVGAGNISDEYLTSLTSYPDLAVRAITDLALARESAQATAFAIPPLPRSTKGSPGETPRERSSEATAT